MNTEANAGAGGNTATTLKDTGRKGPRIAGRAMLLTLGLLAAAAGIFYLAGMMRGIMEDMALADRGEWASLLGGGLGVWAFFLIRSGIIEKALDLVPKAKTVFVSLPAPEWPPFFDSTLELSKTLFMPGLVTVFALVFVGEHVRDQVVDPEPSPVSRQIDELGMALDARLNSIESNIGSGDLQAALDAQGYTAERADRLDRIGDAAGSGDQIGTNDAARSGDAARSDGMDRSDYYFARFPIGFEAGELSDDGTAFIRGADYDQDENLYLVERLVNALIHCGTVNNPVMLRVEGYASSAPFRNATADMSSEDLNLRLANERRRSVKEALDTAIASTEPADARQRILVTEAEDYRTIAEMEEDREFNDRPAGADSNRLPQDFLTRTAHIKVLNPGACRVRSG